MRGCWQLSKEPGRRVAIPKNRSVKVQEEKGMVGIVGIQEKQEERTAPCREEGVTGGRLPMGETTVLQIGLGQPREETGWVFGWCSTIGGQQVTRLAAAGSQLGGESVLWEGYGWILGRCSGRGPAAERLECSSRDGPGRPVLGLG